MVKEWRRVCGYLSFTQVSTNFISLQNCTTFKNFLRRSFLWQPRGRCSCTKWGRLTVRVRFIKPIEKMVEVEYECLSAPDLSFTFANGILSVSLRSYSTEHFFLQSSAGTRSHVELWRSTRFGEPAKLDDVWLSANRKLRNVTVRSTHFYGYQAWNLRMLGDCLHPMVVIYEAVPEPGGKIG